MIKYVVMEFSDVKDFQKFKIKGDDHMYIKVPTFPYAIRTYGIPQDFLKMDENSIDSTEIKDVKLKNCYILTDSKISSNYLYVKEDTEVIVDVIYNNARVVIE